MLSELDQKLMEAATYSAAVQAENEEHEMVYQANLKEVQERQKDGKGGRRIQHPQNSIDHMDVDEPSDGPKLRNRKHVSFHPASFALPYCHSQTDDRHRPKTVPKEA